MDLNNDLNNDGVEPDEPAGHDRRSFLKKAAIGGAVAWTAPMVLSSPASAQGSSVPIEFVNSSTAGNTTDSITIARPTNTLDTDFLVAFVIANAAAPATLGVTAGGAWTQVATATSTTGGDDTVRAWLLTRVAGASLSYTFNRAPNGAVIPGGFRGVVLSYRNVAGVDAQLLANNGNADQNAHTVPSVTTTGINRVVLRLAGAGREILDTATFWQAPPGGFTQRANTGDSDRNIIAFDASQAVAGATGTTTATLQAGENRRAVTGTVALTPSFP